MYLPKDKILRNSPFPKELEALLYYAEEALNKREPIWSPFVSPQLIEEIKNSFNKLNDITLQFEGGFTGAERKRICFLRSDEEIIFTPSDLSLIHI